MNRSEIMKWLSKCSPMDGSDFAEACDCAVDEIESYEKLLERTRWIPVSERLPDADVGSILIYTKNGGVAEGQCYPTIKAWKQFRWSVENANVTHWMPLPEPPEQEV